MAAFDVIKLVFVPLLLAHSWYPSRCCADQDCKEVPCEQVERLGPASKEGNIYRYRPSATEYRDFQANQHAYSPDGRCHVCLYVRSPRCIFTPVPAEV